MLRKMKNKKQGREGEGEGEREKEAGDTVIADWSMLKSRADSACCLAVKVSE